MKGENRVLVRQISVFLENKKGRLLEVTKVLKEHDIDITALSIADTTSFGIVRMIVDKHEDAVEAMRKSGFTVSTTEVLAVKVSDRPGGLYEVLEVLKDNDISIEYAYSFVRQPSENALILFKVEDPLKTSDILKKAGFHTLKEEDIRNL